MSAPSPTLLITRPKADAAAFAVEAEALGFSPFFEPLLEIAPLPTLPMPLSGAQAILFTSANGVRAFAAATPRRDLPAFAVGDATANTARAAGFTAVQSAGGDVVLLAELVANRLDPKAGPLIHAAGESIAGDLAEILGNCGFDVRRVALYRAVKAKALSAVLIAALRAREITHASFFSPRTAAAFVRLSRIAGIERMLAHVVVTALSPNVAAELRAIVWRDVYVAAAPTQKALLAKLLQG